MASARVESTPKKVILELTEAEAAAVMLATGACGNRWRTKANTFDQDTWAKDAGTVWAALQKLFDGYAAGNGAYRGHVRNADKIEHTIKSSGYVKPVGQIPYRLK